ncbi:DVU_1556 family methyltransferase [Anaerovorax odorimutans]|uniref:DVU_1556 family methyltransferase n=1 Tax=Anaerovorax odorimutans TaxID=109327 RepID=UPI0003FD8B02|nr:class I SAM-dependent methyltransferase [Anaerovorax odorimutans]
MKCFNAYENEDMTKITGETLRPGGFKLTEKGIQFCKISSKDYVLDLGCGQGATVNYLFKKHNINAIGIDPSVKLIKIAKEKYGHKQFFIGDGNNIPFQNNSFNCVFAECTLSLMDNLECTLKQVYRVLKDEGWFIITDVYAQNPNEVNLLSQFSFNSCIRNLHNLEKLQEKLKILGFDIIFSEDYSIFLKELFVKIGFTYGTMGMFWNTTTQGCIDGYEFQKALKPCKPGYFMMVARKN